ncbi:thiol-disulfide isomerase/thioredoxin [Brevirhabdus pacifica]|uniref:TlpA family protein disulfide reductase n=1 Tax=Brevirhabdus pacifica TaxID=1267768 RepID=UPI000CB034F7|nr:TlpA disulfide reductase family protein [Brevirhabdus pacifica]PJJ85487.1 thiol-disulfide isomerase/thioredoxin [Brevirhabdus pacifica]
MIRPAPRPFSRPLRLAANALTVLGLGLAPLLGTGAAVAAPEQAFQMTLPAVELPPVRFNDPDGKAMTLEDLRGKTILLNIWATWCPPCVKEMPTLDALQKRLGDDDFQVVILSIDKAKPEVVQAFLDKLGVTELAAYQDDTMLSLSALQGGGLPVTLLIDPEGREIGRLEGPAEWDSEEMIEFIESKIVR